MAGEEVLGSEHWEVLGSEFWVLSWEILNRPELTHNSALKTQNL